MALLKPNFRSKISRFKDSVEIDCSPQAESPINSFRPKQSLLKACIKTMDSFHEDDQKKMSLKVDRSKEEILGVSLADSTSSIAKIQGQRINY